MNKTVIAHYQEDLEWTENLQGDYIVVSKTLNDGKTIFQKENMGNESSAYLQYIVDKWDELKKYPNHVFLHGHRTSWHQKYDADLISNCINEYNGKHEFINFCDNNFYEIYTDKVVSSGDNSYVGDNKPYVILKEVWPDLFKDLGELPEYIAFSPGAQFYVRTDNILKHGKDFYSKSLEWIFSQKATDLDLKYGGQRSTYSSRVFEWLWHFIYTGKPDHVLTKFVL
jgi:hypothetical protein